jgi:hypothetical protein
MDVSVVLTGAVARRRLSYSQRKVRESLRDFLKDKWWAIALYVLFLLVVLAVTVYIYTRVVGGGQGAFLAGLATGAMVAWAVGSVGWLWILFGNGYTYLVGHQGEMSTRDVLRRAQRKGTIFGWVDNVELDRADIDHVVVAPCGVLAIETKYSKAKVRPRDVEAWTAQAAGRARKTSSVMLSSGIKRRESVRPLLVVWGAAPGLEEAFGGEMGEHIVRGDDLGQWLAGQPSGAIEANDALPLVDAMEQFAITHSPTLVAKPR